MIKGDANCIKKSIPKSSSKRIEEFGGPLSRTQKCDPSFPGDLEDYLIIASIPEEMASFL